MTVVVYLTVMVIVYGILLCHSYRICSPNVTLLKSLLEQRTPLLAHVHPPPPPPAYPEPCP